MHPYLRCCELDSEREDMKRGWLGLRSLVWLRGIRRVDVALAIEPPLCCFGKPVCFSAPFDLSCSPRATERSTSWRGWSINTVLVYLGGDPVESNEHIKSFDVERSDWFGSGITLSMANEAHATVTIKNDV
jgi:hypothetical protein